MNIDFSGMDKPAEEDLKENGSMFDINQANPKPTSKGFDDEVVKLAPLLPEKEDFILWQRTAALFSTAVEADDVPEEVKERMTEVAEMLVTAGFIWRSDVNFRNPLGEFALSKFRNVELYKLWAKQESKFPSRLDKPTEKAERIAVNYAFKDRLDPRKESNPNYEFIRENVGHPFFYRSNFPRVPRMSIINRVHLITGAECNVPLSLMIVYSPDGIEDVKDVDYKVSGNIRDALYMAKAKPFDIPVFNLMNEDSVSRISDFIKSIN